MLPFKYSSSLVRNRNITGSTKSRGSLGGGFTKDGLKYWATQHWKLSNSDNQRRSSRFTDLDETHTYYCDLYSYKVSTECINWLEGQSNPSVLLTRAWFGSTRFMLERVLMSPFLQAKSTSRNITDAPLNMNDQYLGWSVQFRAPHELILTYNFASKRGCTMIAFDPSLRKVSTGNCLEIDPNKASTLWKLGIYFHQWYAKFLLKGMALELEKQSKKLN